jgi:hypothetical protein
MTIDLPATHPAATEHHEEIVQFVFRSTASSGLLEHARALLGAAPKELAESFEQAVRSSGLAS